MNAKLAKKLRRILNTNRPGFWKDAQYVFSTHPKEKEHQKIYFKEAVQYTRTGAKRMSYEVPMKVGTLVLEENCGKAIYRRLKEHKTLPL